MVESIHIEKEKERVLYQRLQRKTADVASSEREGYAQVLYELIATAFGAKVNKDPFWQLSRKVPVKRLLKVNSSKRVDILCDASGLIFQPNERSKKQSKDFDMLDWQWKRKGLYPSGFPEIRVRQFAHFIKHFEFDFGFLQLSATELLLYIEDAFSLVDKEFVPTANFKNLIIMNSFVPFIWWLGEKRGETRWHNLAYQILIELPAESNHITKLMQQTGFTISTAYDSQSLLELYNQRCTRKKCLSCGIGNEILNQ